MADKPLNSALKAALEFGPVVGFIVVYLILRNDSFDIGGTTYSGFIVVIATFVPVFLIATGLLWFLTGTIARLQIALAVMLVVFAALTVWFNDPRVFKMKPTVIYLILALILSLGLWRGQSWLKYIMEDMIPLKRKGWMILTKRVTVVFFAAAAANELVWRTQSDGTWLFFETLIMPILILAFFLSQIGLFIEYAAMPSRKKKR